EVHGVAAFAPGAAGDVVCHCEVSWLPGDGCGRIILYSREGQGAAHPSVNSRRTTRYRGGRFPWRPPPATGRWGAPPAEPGLGAGGTQEAEALPLAAGLAAYLLKRRTLSSL